MFSGYLLVTNAPAGTHTHTHEQGQRSSRYVSIRSRRDARGGKGQAGIWIKANRLLGHEVIKQFKKNIGLFLKLFLLLSSAGFELCLTMLLNIKVRLAVVSPTKINFYNRHLVIMNFFSIVMSFGLIENMLIISIRLFLKKYLIYIIALEMQDYELKK